MRKIEKISKKHKILKELSEQSDLFRKIKVLLIFVVIAAAVFLVSYLEHNVLGWLDYFDNYSLPDIFTVYGLLLIGNVVVAAVAWTAYIDIRYIFIPYVCTNIRKMRAIRNYCYIPLTEEEVLQKGFKNAREYFSFVCHLLEYKDSTIPYGSLFSGRKDYKKKEYLALKKEDLREMLLVCITLFNNNGSLFDLEEEDCRMCPESFRNFVAARTVKMTEDYPGDAYVKVEKNGKIKLGFYENSKIEIKI